MKYSLNFAFIIYIKISVILYRGIKWISSKDPNYNRFITELANHNKEILMNTPYLHKFEHRIVFHIPKRVLNILVITEGLFVDVIFLLRLYKTIIEVPEFVELAKVKLVLICSHGEDVFTFTTQFPITPNTTPQDFVTHLYKGLMRLGLKGYGVDKFDMVLVKTVSGDAKGWVNLNDLPSKADNINSGPRENNPADKVIGAGIKNSFNGQVRLYSTSSKLEPRWGIPESDLDISKNPEKPKIKDGRRFILPLLAKGNRNTKIAAFDIETFVYNGKLYPYAIALQYNKYNKTRKVFFYYEATHDSIEKNSAEMLEKMVHYMTENCKSYTIFAHNLGKFDGILMMASIFKALGPHSLIVSKDNRIITMKFKGIKLLDSLRIFPMSLSQLAKQFNSTTQKGSLDFSKITKFNVTDDEIKKEVLSYLEKDISSLHECMISASKLVFEKYGINITDVYSTSSFAMKHFRTSYLGQEGIPLVPKFLTEVISNAYFGAISQVYKPYGKNLYYYDINSLYPWAMTQDMPYEYLGISYNPKLKDIFGFARASIYVPKSLNYKPLPVRMGGILATPSGNILGEYFSEELKYAESIGCTITIHKAYLFSRKQMFNQYVKDLYEEKSKAEGPNRFFVKLLLNGLYGFFARTDEKYMALFLPLDEAIEQVQIYPAYNFIVMDDNETALIIRESQPSKELCATTKHDYYDHLDTNSAARTKSNRAIAAAITAYSRVRIHEFKDICGDIYYSDTDSIVSGNQLPEKYVNDGLGFMKHEFKDESISEAIFISPKLYGLRFNSGKEVIKARGVPEGVLDFNALLRIQKGEVINFKRTQLFKSLEFSSITEKEIDGNVKLNIPIGKVAVYEGDKIVAYKDIHRNLITAVQETPTFGKASERLKRITNYINKVLHS